MRFVWEQQKIVGTAEGLCGDGRLARPAERSDGESS